MPELALERCFNHAWREAVAKCLECGRYYCRECIIDHEDRMVCASCLSRLTEARAKRRIPLSVIARAAFFFVGIFTAWLFFYLIGQGLLALPSSFHEGSIWRGRFWEDTYNRDSQE